MLNSKLIIRLLLVGGLCVINQSVTHAAAAAEETQSNTTEETQSSAAEEEQSSVAEEKIQNRVSALYKQIDKALKKGDPLLAGEAKEGVVSAGTLEKISDLLQDELYYMELWRPNQTAEDKIHRKNLRLYLKYAENYYYTLNKKRDDPSFVFLCNQRAQKTDTWAKAVVKSRGFGG